ncbi:TauD/TfdA family dioxygenase [Streptomyces sp. SID12488]|uniref:TauD/TfdA family dioxygenase n=1 Tax=Streptomyces sp. SID12488 TaxID=2706040 RepID=UPI0013DC3304|nr:TauD/TfdA family dioxygenase [Streptomyces sp. SID12488]NEA67019.1 L-asparagine oxygenase [Streptomyces sp. SID12488]
MSDVLAAPDVSGRTASNPSDVSKGVTELTFSLSSAELARIRDAAEHCVTADIVADPEEFTARAVRAASSLSAELLDGLRMFRRYGSPLGGLLVRGCPVFDIPSTPADPAALTGTTLTAAGIFGIVSAVVGDQYGFKPELGGTVVQDVVPVRGLEQTQQSVSSAEELSCHVESAFAEDRPDFVALLCLRADHDRVAATTLSPIESVLPLLDADTIGILREQRFKTAVDASFLDGIGTTDPIQIGPIQVLSGSPQRPRVRADFAETTGMDDAAQAALGALKQCVDKVAVPVLLQPGDLLFVDNHRAFHGRRPYRAHWDGADRWLLRTSLTRDLSRSEDRRPFDGRIVDTDYSRGDDVLRG